MDHPSSHLNDVSHTRNSGSDATTSGGGGAWDLLEDHRGDLWGYLVNHVRNRADAEDLYQEVNLKVLGNFQTLKEPSAFRSWMFSIAMNTVRSFFRKKQPVPLENEQDGTPTLQLMSDHPNPQQSMEKEEQLASLRRCILKLPERDRDILLLDTMAELPQKDIAEQLNLNLNTVKTITRRARIRLARLMAEENHG